MFTVQSPTLMPRLFISALLLAMSGCSELIPGVNINEGHNGTHEYKVISNQDQGGFDVVRASPVPSYEVIPITSDVLNQLLSEPDQDEMAGVPSLLPSDVPPEYRLGPGDVIFVVVWDHPELTAPYTGLTNDLSSQGRLIAANGNTFYPFVGTFKAAGMTADELRAYITEHIKSVVKDPQVDVRIVSYRAGRLEVTGEVNRPGTLNFDDTPKGVIQAIDAAGGLTLLASRRRAILVRDGVIHTIDLAGLLSGGRLVPNPELKPGDQLHIPDQSGDQAFVFGAVVKPTPVIIQQDSMSLIQALTTAGGLDVLRGNGAGILVFRLNQTPDSKVNARIFTLDMSRPEGVLLASQFQLKPHDVLYVKATDFAQYNSVVAQLLPTITGIYQGTLIQCFASHGASC